jgi:hypothetical protein
MEHSCGNENIIIANICDICKDYEIACEECGDKETFVKCKNHHTLCSSCVNNFVYSYESHKISMFNNKTLQDLQIDLIMRDIKKIGVESIIDHNNDVLKKFPEFNSITFNYRDFILFCYKEGFCKLIIDNHIPKYFCPICMKISMTTDEIITFLFDKYDLNMHDIEREHMLMHKDEILEDD